jgi:hypothetical protein
MDNKQGSHEGSLRVYLRQRRGGVGPGR